MNQCRGLEELDGPGHERGSFGFATTARVVRGEHEECAHPLALRGERCHGSQEFLRAVRGGCDVGGEAVEGGRNDRINAGAACGIVHADSLGRMSSPGARPAFTPQQTLGAGRQPRAHGHPVDMALKLSDPGELIATIPLMLGFMPVDSVVVIGLTASGAMRPVLRADAADFAVVDSAGALSRVAAAQLSRAGAGQAILVGFGGEITTGGDCAVVNARQALSEHVDVVDAWAVAHGRYRSPECVDSRCCPDAGRVVPPPPEVVARAFAAHPHGAPGLPKGPSDRRRKAQRARDRSWTARPKDIVRWRQQRLEAWRAALGDATKGNLPTEADTGKLVAGLRDVAVRDAIVIDLVPGEGSVAESLCVDPSTPGVREALSVMLLPASALAPQVGALDALERLVAHVAWLCPHDLAPAMTVLGLARWWHGDESGAAHAVALALGDNPRYRLAELIKCAIDAHMPPGWLTAA